MKFLSIILVLSLINLWTGCSTQVLIRPGEMKYYENLKDSPKITVFLYDSAIYEFEENQYIISGDTLSGNGSRVLFDTLSNGIHSYDNIITREVQDPEPLKIEINNVEEIELQKYQNYDPTAIIVLSGLAIISVSVYILAKAQKETIRKVVK